MTVSTRLFAENGNLTVSRTQDVEPILEHNKALRNTPQRTESFRHIGSIPNVVLEKWMNEEGAPVMSFNSPEFARFIRKKLNDPDWAHLRTFSGSL